MGISAEGFQQCCNAQVTVEGAQRLIVAAWVDVERQRQSRLAPPVEDVAATQGTRSTTVLADAGYCNEADLGKLEALGVDGYVVVWREAARDAERHPARPGERGNWRRRRYAERKRLAEAPFGWVQETLGFRRCSVRGLRKIRGERGLVCLALNIQRMRRCRAAC